MAQKVTGYIKLQIPAGKATPAPPVGPALGQHGVNIMSFTKEFNERTQKDIGYIIPVVITVYADRTFSFITKTVNRQAKTSRIKYRTTVLFVGSPALLFKRFTRNRPAVILPQSPQLPRFRLLPRLTRWLRQFSQW